MQFSLQNNLNMVVFITFMVFDYKISVAPSCKKPT